MLPKRTTVSKDSWHYRLTRYGLGDAGNHIKRACPYWFVLVPVSLVFGTFRWVMTVLFQAAMYIGYYPWITLGWLLGLKPRYWRGLTASIWDGEETVFLERPSKYSSYRPDVLDWKW